MSSHGASSCDGACRSFRHRNELMVHLCVTDAEIDGRIVLRPAARHHAGSGKVRVPRQDLPRCKDYRALKVQNAEGTANKTQPSVRRDQARNVPPGTTRCDSSSNGTEIAAVLCERQPDRPDAAYAAWTASTPAPV